MNKGKQKEQRFNKPPLSSELILPFVFLKDKRESTVRDAM